MAKLIHNEYFFLCVFGLQKGYVNALCSGCMSVFHWTQLGAPTSLLWFVHEKEVVLEFGFKLITSHSEHNKTKVSFLRTKDNYTHLQADLYVAPSLVFSLLWKQRCLDQGCKFQLDGGNIDATLSSMFLHSIIMFYLSLYFVPTPHLLLSPKMVKFWWWWPLKNTSDRRISTTPSGRFLTKIRQKVYVCDEQWEKSG